MLAQAFQMKDIPPDCCIFASGVSNSREYRIPQFERETQLLCSIIDMYPFKKVIYFSSIFAAQAEFKDIPYYQHKKNMEALVQEKTSNYLIVRLPQIVGNTYNTTIVNYFVNCILNDASFFVQKEATRNLIDCEDVAVIVLKYIHYCRKQKDIINIFGPETITVPDLIHVLENHLSKKAKYEYKNGGEKIKISQLEQFDVNNMLKKIDFNFKERYISHIISKYY